MVTGLVTGTYGDLPANEFGPLCLEEVRDRMIAKGLARVTINGETRRIVSMFKWAAAKQLVPPAVHQALTMVAGLRAGRTVARESVPVRPVEDAVVEKTIVELADRPDRFEHRRRKRRPPLYGYLHLPRNEAKLAMLKGAKKN